MSSQDTILHRRCVVALAAKTREGKRATGERKSSSSVRPPDCGENSGRRGGNTSEGACKLRQFVTAGITPILQPTRPNFSGRFPGSHPFFLLGSHRSESTARHPGPHAAKAGEGFPLLFACFYP